MRFAAEAGNTLGRTEPCIQAESVTETDADRKSLCLGRVPQAIEVVVGVKSEGQTEIEFYSENYQGRNSRTLGTMISLFRILGSR